MIWEAVVDYVRNNYRCRHTVKVEADSFQQAREKLLIEYGPHSINIGPRQVVEKQNVQ
jgi:hypothetical protein